MNLNNQFISNKDMCRVEHELELYYNQYEILAKRNDIDIEQKISSIYFGIDLAIEQIILKPSNRISLANGA